MRVFSRLHTWWFDRSREQERKKEKEKMTVKKRKDSSPAAQAFQFVSELYSKWRIRYTLVGREGLFLVFIVAIWWAFWCRSRCATRDCCCGGTRLPTRLRASWEALYVCGSGLRAVRSLYVRRKKDTCLFLTLRMVSRTSQKSMVPSSALGTSYCGYYASVV